jgi:hypothetical protein
VGKKVAVPGHDHLGIRDHHLFVGGLYQAAPTVARVCHVAPTGTLDDLGVDRAFQSGLQPVRAARHVDTRALCHRRLGQDRIHPGEGLLHVPGQRLAARGYAKYFADQTQGRRGRLEAAVHQEVRDAGLRLHAVREVDVGVAHRAEIDNQVRLDLQHPLEVGVAATAGQSAGAGQVTIGCRDIRRFFRPERARPAAEHLGPQHVDQYRSRRAGREHRIDLFRNLDRAAGAVGNCAGVCRRYRAGPTENHYPEQRSDRPAE